MSGDDGAREDPAHARAHRGRAAARAPVGPGDRRGYRGAAGIRPSAPARDAWRPPRWDLAFRMLAATAMVVVLTALAPRLGPTWTGLLSPFPVFALVLGVFTDRSEGPGAAARLLRGVVLGSLAHATLFALIASLLVPYGPVRAYLWASLGALSVNGLALMLARP